MAALKQFKRKIQFVLLKTFVSYVDRHSVGRSAAEVIKFSSRLGHTLAKLNPGWKRRLRQNLSTIYGDRAESIANSVIEHQLGRVIVDSNLVWKDISKGNFPHDIKFENIESLRKSYDEGKGILIITGHYGTWELLPQATILEGFDYTCIQRKHVNNHINEWLTKNRSHNNCEVIDFHRRLSSNLRDSLSSLKQGRVLGMAADVVNKRRNIPVNFLGKSFPAPPGPAFLAFHSGAPVHTCYCQRDADGYRIVFDDPVPWPNGTPDKKKYDELTQTMFTRLENRILAHPEQWTWYLRRWAELPFDDEALEIVKAKI